MKKITDFSKALSSFFSDYLPHERGFSHNTTLSYRDAFVQLICFFQDKYSISPDKLELKHITWIAVNDFLKWIESKGCSISTRNNRLAAIHSFVKFLQYSFLEHMDEWQRILTIRPKKFAAQDFSYLTLDGIKLLYEQFDLTTVRGRRNYAIVSTMYETGARVQEIADITIDALRLESTPFTLKLHGKGNKYRIVPLSQKQAKILKCYIEDNNLFSSCTKGTPLFFNSRGERMTRAGITYILQMYVNMARKVNPALIPDRISCHSIRHSRAMHLVQAGVNIIYIRDLLGHVSIQTTDIYAKTDSQAKRNALEKVSMNLRSDVSKPAEWEENEDTLRWLKGLGKKK